MDSLMNALSARTAAAEHLSLLVPIPALATLIAVYCTFAPRWPDARSRAYILSTLSSAILTLSSLPFLYAYCKGGVPAIFQAGQEGWTHTLATVIVAAFGTYLFADLAIGYVAYRNEVGFITGWVHHISYMGIMLHLATSKQSCVFLTGAIMELPTFDLAISHLWPQVRSDERFLGLMVLTRILFNLVLVIDCARPASRSVLENSWVPTSILSLALILHSTWMHGGIKGYLKRRKNAAKAAEKERLVAKLAPLEVPTPEFGGVTPEDSPLVTPFTPSQPSVMIPAHLFPTITIPTMANLPIPAIPTLSGMAAALPQAKVNLEQIQFGFKEAVRERLERWEEQRERFAAAGVARLRRRAGYADEDAIVDVLDGQ